MFLLDDNNENDNHVVCQADTTQALTWRLGALCEATDTLHWAMSLAPYPPGGMIVTIIFNYVTFYYIIANRVAVNYINCSIILSIYVNRFNHPVARPLACFRFALDRV